MGHTADPLFLRCPKKPRLRAFPEALRKDVLELLPLMRSPQDFLEESLRLWQHLVSRLRLHPTRAEVPKQKYGQKQKTKGKQKDKCVGVAHSSSGPGAVNGAATKPTHGDEGSEEFERLLRRVWALLGPKKQQYFLSEATQGLANTLHARLQKGLEGDTESSIEERLRDQLTQLATSLQDGRMVRCGDQLQGAYQILIAYERAVKLSPGSLIKDPEGRGNKEAEAKQFWHQSSLHNFSTVPPPTVGQCQALQRWKVALAWQPKAEGSHSEPALSAGKTGLLALSNTLLCYVGRLVIVDFRDLASLAQCCHRLERIAWDKDSWKDVVVLDREFFLGRRHFSCEETIVGGGFCLTPRSVGLLRLALRTFSQKPMYLRTYAVFCPEFVRLWHLVMAWDLQGLRACVNFSRDGSETGGMEPRQGVGRH